MILSKIWVFPDKVPRTSCLISQPNKDIDYTQKEIQLRQPSWRFERAMDRLPAVLLYSFGLPDGIRQAHGTITRDCWGVSRRASRTTPTTRRVPCHHSKDFKTGSRGALADPSSRGPHKLGLSLVQAQASMGVKPSTDLADDLYCKN